MMLWLDFGILNCLSLSSLRALQLCCRAARWECTQQYLPKTVRRFMTVQRQAFQAALACPEPRRGWTESNPQCSAPTCGRRTGYWLPTREEMGGDYEEEMIRGGHFASGESVWGSQSITSFIGRHPPGTSFVACCMECGWELNQNMKIRGTWKREHVVVASRNRVAPRDGFEDCPTEYLLVSEIECQIERRRSH